MQGVDYSESMAVSLVFGLDGCYDKGHISCLPARCWQVCGSGGSVSDALYVVSGRSKDYKVSSCEKIISSCEPVWVMLQ